MPFIEEYQKNLNTALQTPHIKEIIKMEEFYFQKAKDKFNEFLGFDITNVDVTGMIEVTTRKKYKYSYMGTLNSYDSNSVDFKFLLTVGQLITYCDTNGANKHEFNEYADKRAISRANVRQNNWLRWLIEFKIGTDINLMPGSIRNTIQFLQNPEKNLSISSDDWRNRILKTLFQNENGNLFEEMQSTGIVADNPLNNGVLYSWICGSESIKPIWASDIEDIWWPNEDEYLPGFTKDDWKKMWKNDEIFDSKSRVVISSFLSFEDGATCTQVSKKFGKPSGFYNMVSTSLAQKIHQATNCDLCNDDGDIRFFPVLYIGKQAGKNTEGSYI